MKKTVSLVLAAVLLTAVTVFNATYVTVWKNFDDRIGRLGDYEDLYADEEEVRAYIESCYVGEANDYAATREAALAMVDALEDPDACAMTAEEYNAYLAAYKSGTVSLGLDTVYEQDAGTLRVLQLSEDSPAAEAGVAFFDQITRIDGQSVARLGGVRAQAALRGKKGTDVTITVWHTATGVLEDLTLTRRATSETSVEPRMLNASVGYVALGGLSSGSGKAVTAAVKTLQEQGAESLILDLRFNPGGDAKAAAGVVDTLVGEGVSLRWSDAQGNMQTQYSDKNCADLNLVVLVNGYTSREAECIAAGLQEYGAKVVGEQSAGRGYIQSGFRLKDGSGLILSTSQYFTPSGVQIQNIGVRPDVEAQLETPERFHSMQDAEDPQLQAALELVS